jgi:hypothetical protein
MKAPNFVLGISALALCFASGLSASTPVRNLLSDARENAVVVSNEAGTVSALSRQMGISWQSHATSLERMKENVNDLARRVREAQALADQATPEQRQALTRARAILPGLVADLNYAIRLLENRNVDMAATPIGTIAKRIETRADALRLALRGAPQAAPAVEPAED